MTSEVAMSRLAVLVPRDKTLIAVLLDRSASMADCREEMQAGFASFIDGQRAVPGQCSVSLYQFDHQWEAVYSGVPLDEVPPLELEPRGNTALQDAIARTITAVQGQLAGQVIMVIITDGDENASTELPGERGRQKVAQMIGKLQAQGWRFVFLGAGRNVFAQAAGYRIARRQTLRFDHTATRQAMSDVTDLVVRARGEKRR